MDFFTIPVVVGTGSVLWFRACAVVAVVFALVNLADFIAPPAFAERVSITRVSPIQVGKYGRGTRIEAMGSRAHEWRIRWDWNDGLRPGMGADITTTAVTGRLRTIHLLNGERVVWSWRFQEWWGFLLRLSPLLLVRCWRNLGADFGSIPSYLFHVFLSVFLVFETLAMFELY